MNRYLVVLAWIGLMISAPALAGSAPASTAPAATALAATAQPAPEATTQPAPEHVIYMPDDLKWVDGPPSLPKGAQVVTLTGDPAAAGPFTIRIMVPAGYKVPPHFHPADENLTVLSGDLFMAVGDTWDESKGHILGKAAFSIMPKGMHHYAWSVSGAVLQVHGMGPWGITYVNPADDPRNMKRASK
jgi:hypothetical protein